VTELICPDCGFDSDDEVEFANHRRDRHLATVFSFADQHAYDIWLEGQDAA
jgi:hypothetical protein